MNDPIRVNVEYPCPCPGTPHTAEWVDLEPAATMPMGMAAMACLQKSDTTDENIFYGELAPIVMRFGIRAWSFIDEKGGKVGINATTIAQLLPFGQGGYEVANQCLGLYLEELMRPLVKIRLALLASIPTAPTTSPTPESGPKPPTPLSRSSRKSTAGSTSEAPAP